MTDQPKQTHALSAGGSRFRRLRLPPVFATWIRLWACCSLLCLLPTQAWSQGLPPQVTQPQVKAAFVYNFLKFIEWPAEQEHEEPIRIGLYGLSEEFAEELKKLQGKSVRSQKLEMVKLENLADPEERKGLRVLILNPAEEEDLLWLKEQSPQIPELLIIGEEKNVADQGGMIDFYVQRDRVRFRINRKRVEAANLKVSSKLLRLAKIVTEESP